MFCPNCGRKLSLITEVLSMTLEGAQCDNCWGRAHPKVVAKSANQKTHAQPSPQRDFAGGRQSNAA